MVVMKKFRRMKMIQVKMKIVAEKKKEKNNSSKKPLRDHSWIKI